MEKLLDRHRGLDGPERDDGDDVLLVQVVLAISLVTLVGWVIATGDW